jgi:predicted nucleic acid-binding Zn ribbon protein
MAFTSVLEQWSDIVGEGLAARFRPTGLYDGTLVVATDDGAAIASVRWLEQDLLSKLQEAVGATTVTALRFVVRAP